MAETCGVAIKTQNGLLDSERETLLARCENRTQLLRPPKMGNECCGLIFTLAPPLCRHIGGGEFSTTLDSSLLERRVCVNLFLPCLPARQRQVQAEGHVLSLLLAVVLFVGVSAGNTRSVADKRIVRIENNENALSVSNASLHRFWMVLCSHFCAGKILNNRKFQEARRRACWNSFGTREGHTPQIAQVYKKINWYCAWIYLTLVRRRLHLGI